MRTSLLLSLLLIFTISLYSQSYYINLDIEEYKTDTIGSEFNTRFSKETDKTNFKLLREFLREKKDLLNVLQNEMLYSINAQEGKKFRNGFQKVIDILNLKIKNKNSTDIISLNSLSEIDNRAVSDYYYRIGDYYSSVDQYFLYNYDTGLYEASVETIKELIEKYTDDITTITNKMNASINLTRNIKNVNEDIYECESQIDSALAPEYKEQEFRTSISLYFTILIGVLLVVFFFIVYKRSDENLSKELLSGNGLQFVTLFVLIIAIILFGILSILQGSELAAILAGISGYILGKGIPEKKNDGTAENRTE